MKANHLLVVAVAVGVALAGAAALAVSTTSPPEDPSPSPTVTVSVTNVGAVAVGDRVEGTVAVTREDEVLLDEPLELGPGETWSAELDPVPGRHQVEVELRYESESLRSSVSHGTSFNPSGCLGPTRAALEVVVRNPEDPDMDVEVVEAGCFGSLDGYAELLEEARRVIEDPPSSGGEIHVPMPRVGDAWSSMYQSTLPPDWDNASASSAHWERFHDIPDLWGRVVDGYEVVPGAAPDPDRGRVEEVMTGLKFRARDPGAFLYSSGSGSRAYAVGTLLVTESGERSVSYVRYVDPAIRAGCTYRNLVQGTTLRTGQGVPASDLCGGPDTELGPWTAGEVTGHRGMRAVPLYRVTTDDDRTVVARLWFADGVPYPVDREVYAVGGDAASHFSASRLSAFRQGDAPLPAIDPGPDDPAPDLRPLDPLAGPALEAARDRFAFPLDEASRAARDDRTLQALQRLLDDDAVLAGAAYAIRRDAGAGPGTAERPTWYLVFTAPGTGAVGVVCELPTARAAALADLRTVARCEEVAEPPDFAAALEDPPTMGPDGLAARAVSFDDAVVRWDAMDPVEGPSPVRSVLYRTWSDGPPWDSNPRLVVGDDVTLPGAVPTGVATDVSLLHIDLETARSLSFGFGSGSRDFEVLGTSGGLPPVGDDHLPAGARTDPSLPLLAGTAALGALGVIGLLWYLLASGKASFAALYSRIRGRHVLDHEVRARIVSLVREEPGVHAHAVEQALELGHGQTDHHLRVLVREGLLTEIESAGFRRYFVPGAYDLRDMRVMAALKNGQNEKAYRIIRSHPGIGVSDLADRADISVPYASKTAAELADAGLVDKVRDGRRVSLYAMEE